MSCVCSNGKNGVPLPPLFIGHLEDVSNKVRVIGIPDCLDSAGVDISKHDCSSRDNVRVFRRPCCIYSNAAVP